MEVEKECVLAKEMAGWCKATAPAFVLRRLRYKLESFLREVKFSLALLLVEAFIISIELSSNVIITLDNNEQ